MCAQEMKAGRDRGLVRVPAKVGGVLGDGSWQILGIAAGAGAGRGGFCF